VVLAVGTSHESGVGSGNAGLGWASASRRSPDHSFLCEQNTAASLCYEPSNLLMHRKCLVHHIVIIIIFVFHEIKWGNLLRFFEGGREGGRRRRREGKLFRFHEDARAVQSAPYRANAKLLVFMTTLLLIALMLISLLHISIMMTALLLITLLQTSGAAA